MTLYRYSQNLPFAALPQTVSDFLSICFWSQKTSAVSQSWPNLPRIPGLCSLTSPIIYTAKKKFPSARELELELDIRPKNCSHQAFCCTFSERKIKENPTQRETTLLLMETGQQPLQLLPRSSGKLSFQKTAAWNPTREKKKGTKSWKLWQNGNRCGVRNYKTGRLGAQQPAAIWNLMQQQQQQRQ